VFIYMHSCVMISLGWSVCFSSFLYFYRMGFLLRVKVPTFQLHGTIASTSPVSISGRSIIKIHKL